MIRRKPPVPASYGQNSRLAWDPQVKKWVQRLEGDPKAKPGDLDEAQLSFIYAQVMQRRCEDFEPGLFERKMIETCPILTVPDMSDSIEDLGHIFQQPEIMSFWQSWRGPKAPKGPAPAYEGAKAVMAVLAMTGQTAHVNNAHERLVHTPGLKAVFESLGAGPLTIPAYKSLDRLFERLAGDDACRWLAMSANIELLKWLRAHHPNGRQVGRRLLVDASPIPAWVVQRSAGSKDDPGYQRREERLRKHAPHAGFRAYTYSAGGKDDLAPEAKVKISGAHKWWRGYYLAVIVDQATGLPLVWMLFDASVQETNAIVPLLSDLHRLWPDIDANLIAGDSAWGTNEICRMLEVDYGIAPIFRLKPSEVRKREWIPLQNGESRDGSIAAITYQGQVVCDVHRKPLAFSSDEQPSRRGLRPGQSTNEGAHRIRCACNHTSKAHPRACNKLSLRMQVNWHRLTRYPHHNAGNPERYAMRQAMLIRLNQVEGLFNRLKGGLHLGGSDSTRTRVRDRASYEALFSLGLVSMTALVVADVRLQLAETDASKAA